MRSKNLLILVFILIFSSFLHLYRLDYPNAYVFDEVYHAFTAKEYLKGSKAAWEWWTVPPPGVAFEWTHPPLAKEIMASSMYILKNQDAFAWRLPGAILGILATYLIYLLSKKLFENENIALISAFLFSLEGLNFVQSRTGMNDVYLVFFTLLSLLFLLKNKHFYSAIFTGLALSSKWSALYLIAFIIIWLLKNKKYKTILFYLIIPPYLYLFCYLPFFLLGHSVEQFINLQSQMWWYHSMLKATHDYSSPWWSWPINLYPVWYYVEYHKNSYISNIFASGNPSLSWFGFGAILVTIWDYLKSKNQSFLFILLGFFIFWLPWAFSPRIMFLYHYSPSLPFLVLALGYQINLLLKDNSTKYLSFVILGLIILGFILYYPFITGIPLPKDKLELFFQTNLTKNPF